MPRLMTRFVQNRLTSVRLLQLLLIALFMAVSVVGPVSAQSAPEVELKEVQVFMQDGWRSSGRHAIADDFVIVCPVKEVLEDHPCSETNSAQLNYGRMRDLVLVCPVEEVIEQHPCAERKAQIVKARPTDFVLVCPVEEVLDDHPCAETKASTVKFEIPKDYVMTCPTLEVLDPGHPCAERNRVR